MASAVPWPLMILSKDEVVNLFTFCFSNLITCLPCQFSAFFESSLASQAFHARQKPPSIKKATVLYLFFLFQDHIPVRMALILLLNMRDGRGLPA